MNNRYAEVHGGFEFHLVNGTLFITDEKQPKTQVQLSSEAIDGMIEYLAAMGVIPGRVKHLGSPASGVHVYLLKLGARDGTPIELEITMHNGELEGYGPPTGVYGGLAEDGEDIEAQ